MVADMTFQNQSPDKIWESLLNTPESKAFLDKEIQKAMEYLNSQQEK